VEGQGPFASIGHRGDHSAQEAGLSMTGANTDPISTPDWMVAPTLLLRIGQPLFKLWMHSDPEDTHAYKSWVLLRLLAEGFVSARSLSMGPVQRAGLTAALQFVLEIQDLPSKVPDDIRELEKMLAISEVNNA
jgi:hypothetical protein